MPIDYPIPLASKTAFENLAAGIKRNPGLIFDRFVPDTQEQRDNGGQRNREETPKKHGLNAVRSASEKADSTLLVSCHTRWNETVKRYNALIFDMSTDWRFVTGLGRKGPFEVGFTFNRYGFPYLPGSSVKGIARTKAFFDIAEKITEEGFKALFQKVYENPSEQEIKEKKYTILTALDLSLSRDKDEQFEEEFKLCSRSSECQDLARKFRKIFGNTGTAGGAVFFDAIPDSRILPVLDLDIINPHYPEYYEDIDGKKGKYPTDWQSPIPTYFLTVAPNTKFWFAVGRRSSLDMVAQDQTKNWLKAGLEKIGAGAKTSAGYGYFK